MLTDSFTKQGTNYEDIQDSPRNQSIVRRKPGRPPKQHPPGTINGIIAECAVCHDKATGLHYAVMTCEGCKGFFKRSIQAEKLYKCRGRGECVINKDSRNACQACRMKSCYDVGMKEKLVRDDRTPGNRKKNVTDLQSIAPLLMSDNSDRTYDCVKQEPLGPVKQEGTCVQDHYTHITTNQRYLDTYNHERSPDLSLFNFGNISFAATPMNQELMYGGISLNNDFDDWDLSAMGPESRVDGNHTDIIHHISSINDGTLSMQPISINCSGDQEMPLKKCKHSPKCLMHLLTRLLKAKPLEPAFCKYFGRYPTSEQFLDCLADEIHLIIKFAKKTPGFCELSMNRKLSVVQKHALGILFVRILYRSLSCPMNHVQFASNLCLNYNEFDKIEVLSSRFRQAIIELISSFRSLNLDLYELCLIHYAIIEDEDWEPDFRYYPGLEGFDKPTDNNSQTYLKLYTTNKYPEQPHRWIFIMLSLTQVQEMVNIFTAQCIDLVNAQRMIISNDILKEILSL